MTAPRKTTAVADQLFDPPEASILDLLDHLLNKGVMLNADVTLGVAGIDLIYLRLSSLLAAADRVLPGGGTVPSKSRRTPSSRRVAKRRS